MRQGHKGGWVAAMDIRKVAVTGNPIGSLNKESLNDIIFRKMALFISSCWFFISNSLILLISFLARQVFRIFKIDDSSQDDDYNVLALEPRCLELMRSFTEFEEKDYDLLQDKETSNFSFKFQYQISEDQRGSNEEPVVPVPPKEEPISPVVEGKEPSVTTSISKYRFLAEKDFSGFVQEPEVKTFRVQESYIGSETDYLCDKDTLVNRSGTSSLSAKDFQQPTVESVNVDALCKQGGSKDAILIENKHLAKEKAVNYETSSAKDFQEPSSLNAIKKLGESEDAILIETKYLEKEKAVNYETSSSGEKGGDFQSAKDFQEPSSLNATKKLDELEDAILIKNKLLEKEKAIDSETGSSGEKEAGLLSAKDFQQPYVKENTVRKLGKAEDVVLIQNKLLEKEKAIASETSSLGEKEVAFLSAKKFREPNAEDVNAKILKATRKLSKSEDVILIKNKPLGKEKAINYKKGGGFLSTKKIQEPSVEGVSTYSLSAIRKQGKSEDVILIKNKLLEKEIATNSETSSLGKKEVTDGARFLPEDFPDFDSDSESLSFSDGYSVKDLIVDSDSEGFLSERDSVGYEIGSDTTEASMNTSRYKTELLEDINKMEEDLLQFYHNDSGSADLSGCFPYIENRINPESIDSDDIWSENESSKPASEQKELNEGEAESREFQKVKERKRPGSNALHMDFTDSSDDELYSERHIGSFRKSLDEVWSVSDSADPEAILKELDGREAEDFAKNCNFEKIKSEPSNTRCDASTGSPLRPIHIAEQEDAVELRREMDELEQESELGSEKKSQEKDVKKSEENNLKDLSDEDLDDEDFDELESLWEHQDLIEQLKMELKKAKAFGLPTILEESESPKTVEDLKPWKIDEQFLHEDPMDELHKFYKSYRERMRKFDILNYQKMYAIGFLQLKDPLQSMGSQKPLLSTITSIISQSFWPHHRKSNTNPSEKFIKELRDDLEAVYVGQTCLSWEFLRWQYEKARELPETDPYRSHQYNQVAGEFQQFQVIVQRFIENESFQGPRLPNYVKNRCVLRNLLQVPVIKEDCLKDKMEEQRKGYDAITSEMLEDIMEESIRAFWEFVKADKDETPVILKGLVGTQVELQDPSDYGLMMDIQATLQKKEKKLKDLLRTGNCLVKKFKKPKEDRSNQDLFFSQVDLKLVSRVLKMSRITTDQLVWCHKKLNKITFVDKKILREPAFLLFPC